jgi:signal transduction histidine kinase
MERDLEILIGEEWLSEALPAIDSKTRADWQNSGLYAAIQESRALGLEIESTGDLAAVARLGRESSVALGLAVKQCLVNVLRHSGTTHAEVAIYGSETDVSVMVVDTGRGFSEGETGADRLGLRTSVRRRIEAIQGSVQVWSTPGRGTSIMIRIPTDAVAATSETA